MIRHFAVFRGPKSSDWLASKILVTERELSVTSHFNFVGASDDLAAGVTSRRIFIPAQLILEASASPHLTTSQLYFYFGNKLLYSIDHPAKLVSVFALNGPGCAFNNMTTPAICIKPPCYYLWSASSKHLRSIFIICID